MSSGSTSGDPRSKDLIRFTFKFEPAIENRTYSSGRQGYYSKNEKEPVDGKRPRRAEFERSRARQISRDHGT